MSRGQKEAIVFLLDVGPSMSKRCHDSEKSIFCMSKECIENIIKQKIFSESKNEYLLVEFGSDETQHNIKVHKSLSLPSFDFLRYINSIQQTNIQANFVDAMEVAVDALIQGIKGQKFVVLKMAIFTNFGESVDFIAYQDLIEQSFKEQQIEPMFICDFTEDDLESRALDKNQLMGIELMKLTKELTSAQTHNLSFAASYFNHFENKKINSAPWYANLQLGDGLNSINIPIAGYIKITAYKRKTGKETYFTADATEQNGNEKPLDQKPFTSDEPRFEPRHEPNAETPIEKVSTYQATNEESIEEIAKEDVVTAYTYGSTLVPFTDDDKASMSYQASVKGLQIIGFTQFHNILPSYKIGDKTMIVIPDPRQKDAYFKKVFQGLARALMETNKVAIVRYAYRDKVAPQIGFLMPFEEEKNIILIYIQLPFAEDVRRYRFPSLEAKPQYVPSQQQLDSIDNLIDSMDLLCADVDEEGNSCEALLSQNIRDPFLQYWFESLYHRNLYNDANTLPNLSDELKDSIDAPLKIRKNAAEPLQKLSHLFALEVIKEKSKQKRDQVSASSSNEPEASGSKRPRIEENVTPVNVKEEDILDESYIKSVPLPEMSKMLKKLFSKLNAQVFESAAEKIAGLVKFFRQESILNNEPDEYNEFMIEFKKLYKGTIAWYMIIADECGLIGKSECDASTVSQQEIESFVSIMQN